MAKIRSSISSSDAASDLSKAMSLWLDSLSVPDLFRTCLSCLHFQNKSSYCKRFNVVPPGNIIITGCDEGYEDNEDIPF